MKGIRGLTARAGISVCISKLRRHLSKPRFSCEGCVLVILTPVSVDVCGWGEGSVIPHTAVLSPLNPHSILCTELPFSLSISSFGAEGGILPDSHGRAFC